MLDPGHGTSRPDAPHTLRLNATQVARFIEHPRPRAWTSRRPPMAELSPAPVETRDRIDPALVSSGGWAGGSPMA
jgi:hypothetical protein